MIYTVTFNPSLDYIVSMNDFQLGKTNRTTEELILPGGKGLNVSTVLHNLGIENTALGFTAGFVGEEIKRLASAIGYGYDFIDVQNGTSRINVKLKDFDGTEINGMGPEIDGNALNALMEKLRMLKEGDTLILAGSIPASMPKSIYSDILKVLDGKGIDFVVDATKELLLNVLQYHPFLIKPNNYELGELFGVKLEKKEQIEPYARKLQELGARNVLVSMAGEGAVLLDESGNLHQLDAPKGKLVNAVGAGDSMVAGFLAGWIEKKDYLHAFKMAVCAGSASAFSEGYAKKEEIETLYHDL
jgi:1-phosphofructokinase